MHRAICNMAGTSGSDGRWYYERANEVFQRVSPVFDVTAASNPAKPGDCLRGYKTFLDTRATPTPAGWLPIESAPRDGRGIIVIDMTAEKPEAGQAWFKHGVWTAVCPDGAIALEAEVYRAMTWPTPTHWRPLPSPPTGPAEGGV